MINYNQEINESIIADVRKTLPDLKIETNKRKSFESLRQKDMSEMKDYS
jgi:hypothetical protein